VLNPKTEVVEATGLKPVAFLVFRTSRRDLPPPSVEAGFCDIADVTETP